MRRLSRILRQSLCGLATNQQVSRGSQLRVAVLPVPMAHTGSYATTSLAAFLAEMAWKARRHWRRSTSSVRLASRSSSTSPTQTIGVRPASRAAFSFEVHGVVGFTEILAALRVADDHVGAADSHQHAAGDFAGVCALLFPVEVLRADGDVGALAASIAAAISIKGGQTTISSRVWPATRGEIVEEGLGLSGCLVHLPVGGHQLFSGHGILWQKSRALQSAIRGADYTKVSMIAKEFISCR